MAKSTNKSNEVAKTDSKSEVAKSEGPQRRFQILLRHSPAAQKKLVVSATDKEDAFRKFCELNSGKIDGKRHSQAWKEFCEQGTPANLEIQELTD